MATILLVVDRVNIFRTFKFIIDPSNLNVNGPRFARPSLFEHERYREVVEFYDILSSGKKTEGKETQDFFKDLAQKASTLCLPPSKAVQGGRRRIREKLDRKKKKNEERRMDIDRVGVEQKLNRRRESSRRSTL